MNIRIDFQTKLLQEVVDEYLLAKQAERYSPSTLRSYKVILNLFANFMGPIRFTSIDADDVRHWFASLGHLSGKSLFNYYITLSSLWSWGLENNYCKDQIIRKIRKPRYNIKAVQPFSEAEVRRIIAACHSVRERAIVLVLLDTGLRASEVAGLIVDDWSDLALRIRHGKGDKERTVPISKITERLIYHHLRRRSITPDGIDSGDHLFQSAYYTMPLTYDSLRYLMKELEARSGVENIHCHRFRHTFAITYLRNGGDIYTLKRILGHSTLEMVQHYLAIASSDVKRTHAMASPVSVWQITG